MKRTKRTTLEPRPVVEPGTEPHRGRCSVCGYAIGKGGCWFNPAHTNTNTNAKREVENGDMRAVLTDGGPGGRAEVRGLRGAVDGHDTRPASVRGRSDQLQIAL